MRSGSSRIGFTLVELLIVIAIIGILIALTLPAVQRARQSAYRIQCQNNLHQIGIALHQYHEVHKHFPMGSWNGLPFYNPHVTKNTRGGTWLIEILPYIEENAVYLGLFTDKALTFDGSGSNNPKNAMQFVRKGPISILTCPSSTCSTVTGSAPPNCNAGLVGLCIPSYVGISGADMGYWEGDDLRFKTLKPDFVFNTALGSVATDGILVPCRAIAVKDIPDGTSNTIAVAEQSDWGSVGGNELDIRSSAVVGGFFGTGGAGLRDFAPAPVVEAPTFAGWQFSDYWQPTSTALTTVRWPLNFKKLDIPPRSWQWDFRWQKWRNCNSGPIPCGGRWSGLWSGEIGGPLAPCYKRDFGIGGNLPIQSAHSGGAHVLFADGHVAFLTDVLASRGVVQLAGRGSVLERLCVRDDGQLVELPD